MIKSFDELKGGNVLCVRQYVRSSGMVVNLILEPFSTVTLTNFGSFQSSFGDTNAACAQIKNIRFKPKSEIGYFSVTS